MVFWRDYNFDNLVNAIVKDSRKRSYDDNIYTFDIEVSSVFDINGEIRGFDSSIKASEYRKFAKYGICYIWQFSINNTVLYGRYLNEFLELLEIVKNKIVGTVIIYIHNLSYEFQFLRNLFPTCEVFARKSRHPIRMIVEELNVEFRCSLALTNMALSKLAKNFSLSVCKKDGQLDYLKVRTPVTKMTSEELEYCEYDCLVLYELIKLFKKEYVNVHNIPMTQTGRLRRVVKKIYKNNTGYYKRLTQMMPITYDEFKLLCDSYAGGYTHANALYTSQVIDNVFSKDITSSYPTVMVAEKYPCTRFIQIKERDLNNIDNEKAYIIDITFFDLSATCSCTYLSKSKALEVRNSVEDNGRIVTAEYARFRLTEIDMDIVKQSYKFSYQINECYMALKDYLDRDLVEYILQLYSNKTKLKNVAGKEDLYRQAKEFINAMYGMCVTNTIRDDVTYDGEWGISVLTKEAAEEKLISLTKRRKSFLNYAWGVWVTAYARHNLWEVMLQMADCVVYTDTDSIKYIDKNNEKYFLEYNKKVLAKLEKAVNYHGIPVDLLNPVDPKGKHHPLGIYDDEPMYDKFVTLGAKKYCYEQDGHLGITVSGVNKTDGVRALSSIEDFVQGFTFGYNNSGRLILSYNDCQPELEIQDYQGNICTINQQYGINMMPTTYTLSLFPSYEDYILSIANKSTTKLSILEERNV